MSLTNNNNNNKSKTNNTWGLDTNSLEEWLENDLRQSSLFNKKRPAATTDKCSLNHIISQVEEEEPLRKDNISIKKEQLIDIKEEEKERKQPLKKVDDTIPSHCIPLIKVYSLLNTIRQNDRITKDKNHHASIKQIYTAPAPPLSPLTSVNSDVIINNDARKKRVNNRTPVDIITKRQRNTDAARRSRLRKANKMETLEHKVDVLQKDNNRLRVKVAVLENDICHATEKDRRNRLRVLELEAQLALAHTQLVKEYKNED